MADVTIYTTMLCGYCARAKALLTKKGVIFHEIDVGMNIEKRREMESRSNGGQTVPQIFINGAHIGGCDDLHALDAAGKLDPLLAA